MASLTKEEKIEAAATILEMLIAGESEDAIMAALGMSAETYQEARKFMLDLRATEVRSKTREQVYVEYVIEQLGNKRLIDNLLGKLDDKRHYNAIVGAIRLRADLADRVLEQGFNLGVVKKQAERHEIVGGLAIGAMSSDDLRAAIREMVDGTSSMVTKSGGEVDIMSLDPGELHSGTGVIEAPVEDDSDLLPPPEAPPERKKATAIVPAKPTSTAKPAVKPAVGARPAVSDALREGVRKLTTPRPR